MALRRFTQLEQEEVTIAENKLKALPNPHRQLYRTVDIRGKGKGLRAEYPIPMGTLIVDERPRFEIANVTVPLSAQNEADIRLKDGEHPEFSRHCPRNQRNPETRFLRNNFQMSDEIDGRINYGIFLEAARINHSCRPNAHWSYNRKWGRFVLYAIHEIAVNEEITINYTPHNTYDNRVTRSQVLNDYYGFHCTCAACQDHESDTRRKNMKFFVRKIDPSQGSEDDMDLVPVEGVTRMNSVRTLLNLYKDEGLWDDNMAEAHRWEAECYEARQKQGADVVKAARNALFYDVKCFGADSVQVRETLKWMGKLKA